MALVAYGCLWDLDYGCVMLCMDVYGHICILDVNGIFKKIKDAFLASVFLSSNDFASGFWESTAG